MLFTLKTLFESSTSASISTILKYFSKSAAFLELRILFTVFSRLCIIISQIILSCCPNAAEEINTFYLRHSNSDL